MKQNLTNLLLAIAALAAFNSCSSDDVYTGKDIPGSKLMVSGAIQQQQTRVSGTTWDDGDAIGIHDGALARNVNVKYLASNSGAFTPAGSDIYVLGGDEVTFNAYYPYSENVTADHTAIAFDAASGENVDFLWATTTASREMPSAAFLFSHKMSKINITIDGTGHTANAEMTVSLKGVATSGSFETTTGVVTAAATKGSITASGKFGQAVSFILPPAGTPGNVDIAIMIEDKYYQGTFNPSLNASAQVNYTIDLSTADEKNNITVSSGTITDWTTSNGGSIVVTETEAPLEENAVLEVGDFLMKDGTTVDRNATLSASVKGNVAGVVYYVGNAQGSQSILATECPSATHGLAIALSNANETAVRFNNSVNFNYSTQEGLDSYVLTDFNASKPSTTILGYNNTAVLKYVYANNDTFNGPSEVNALTNLETYQAANAVTGASNWYLPSYAEWTEIVSNYATISASLAKAGGSLTQFTEYEANVADKSFTGMFYWTSTLRGNSNSWVSPAIAVTDESILSIARNSNSYKGYFRFAIAF